MVLSNQAIYNKMEIFAAQCRALGHHEQADIILHRLHQVAWTSRSELLQELRTVLIKFLDDQGDKTPSLNEEIQQLIIEVNEELDAK